MFFAAKSLEHRFNESKHSQSVFFFNENWVADMHQEDSWAIFHPYFKLLLKLWTKYSMCVGHAWFRYGWSLGCLLPPEQKQCTRNS